MPHSVLLIDTLSKCNARIFTAAFFLALIVFVVLGVVGPDRSERTALDTFTANCSDVQSCNIELSTHVGDLRPLQQYLNIYLLVDRPRNASEVPFSPGVEVSALVRYIVDVQVDGRVDAHNVSHEKELTWHADGSSARVTVVR